MICAIYMNSVDILFMWSLVKTELVFSCMKILYKKIIKLDSVSSKFKLANFCTGHAFQRMMARSSTGSYSWNPDGSCSSRLLTLNLLLISHDYQLRVSFCELLGLTQNKQKCKLLNMGLMFSIEYLPNVKIITW